MKWSLVYEKAIKEDGSLLFPERLTKEFLEYARRTMGSYLFANQYQNEVIPDDEKTFNANWIRIYKEIPENTYRFGFIDPAIGQEKHHDFTGVAIIDVDSDGIWYLRVAARYRLNPTQIVDKMFELQEQWNLKCLGVESQAYQEALLYILDEKMRREKKIVPVKGIKRTQISKNTRILGLVPRFEWGRLLVSQGMTDFEDEYSTFPRGTHNDILDSIASLEEIVFYPQKTVKKLVKPHSPHDPHYEKWVIQDLVERQRNNED